MSSYDAIINIIATGSSKIEKIISKVSQLESIVDSINKKPIDINAASAQRQVDSFYTKTKILDANIQTIQKSSNSASKAFETYSARLNAANKILDSSNPNTKKYAQALDSQKKAQDGITQSINDMTKAEKDLTSAQEKRERAGLGLKEAEKAKEAAAAVRQLADDYLLLGAYQQRSIKSGQILKDQSSVTVSQLRAQANALALVANNSKIASSEFNRFSIAGQVATGKIYEAQQKKLQALAFGLSPQAPRVNIGRQGESSISAARSQVSELVNSYSTIVKSEAAMAAFVARATELQSIVPIISNEWRVLGSIIDKVKTDMSSTRLSGQSSKIGFAKGPYTDLGSISAFTKRESYQRKVNDELSRQVAVEDRINQGLLNQVQKAQLLNQLYQAADALAQNRLDDAVRITREIDKQRFSLERLNRSTGPYKTGLVSPMDGGKRLSSVYSANQMLASKLLELETKGINVSSEKLTLLNQVNRIQSATFDINTKNLNLENETLAAISSSITLLQRKNNILKGQQKGYPSSPIGGGVSMPGSPIFNQTPFLERRFGRKGSAAISEGLIGGAFPLLFGQGLGASIGGGLGGAAGGFAGGGLGFGLSLIGTALGSAFDTLGQEAIKLGKSLQDPVDNFEQLTQSSFFSSKALEKQIRETIKYGDTVIASALIQQDAIDKLGVSGVEKLTKLSDASDKLGRAWSDFYSQLEVALAGPMAGLLNWLASVVANAGKIKPPGDGTPGKPANSASSKGNGFGDFMGRMTGAALSLSTPIPVKTSLFLLNKSFDLAKEINSKVYGGSKQEQKPKIKFKPEDIKGLKEGNVKAIEKQLEAMDAGKSIIDQMKRAADEQKSIDKERAEIVRGYEEGIGQIRQRIEDEISRRRFSLLEKENQILDLQGQNRIKTLELETQKIVNSAGAGQRPEVKSTAQDAARIAGQLMKDELTNEEESAKIKRDSALEAKKINFEAVKFNSSIEKEISKLKIETANRVLAVNEKIIKMNRDQDKQKFKIEKEVASARILSSSADTAAEIKRYEEALKLNLTDESRKLIEERIRTLKAAIDQYRKAFDAINGLRMPPKFNQIFTPTGGTGRGSNLQSRSAESSTNVSSSGIGDQFLSLIGNQNKYENLAMSRGDARIILDKLTKEAVKGNVSPEAFLSGIQDIADFAQSPDRSRRTIRNAMATPGARLLVNTPGLAPMAANRLINQNRRDMKGQGVNPEAVGKHVGPAIDLLRKMKGDNLLRSNVSLEEVKTKLQQPLYGALMDWVKANLDNSKIQDILGKTRAGKANDSWGARGLLPIVSGFQPGDFGVGLTPQAKKEALLFEQQEAKRKAYEASPEGRRKLAIEAKEAKKFREFQKKMDAMLDRSALPSNFDTSRISQELGRSAALGNQVFVAAANTPKPSPVAMPSTKGIDGLVAAEEAARLKEERLRMRNQAVELLRTREDFDNNYRNMLDTIQEPKKEVLRSITEQLTNSNSLIKLLEQGYNQIEAEQVMQIRREAQIEKERYKGAIAGFEATLQGNKFNDIQEEQLGYRREALSIQLQTNRLTESQRSQIATELANIESQLKKDTVTDAGAVILQQKINELRQLRDGITDDKIGEQISKAISATRATKINNEIAQLKTNLSDLRSSTYQVVEGAKAIGGAFSDSFKGAFGAMFVGMSPESRNLNDQVKQLENERNSLGKQMQERSAAGQTTFADADTKRYADLSEEISKAKMELNQLGDVGTKVQGMLADSFQKIADHFLDMAAQMLTQQLVLKLIGFGLSFLNPAAGAAKGLGSVANNLNQYAPLPNAKGNVFSNSVVSSPTLFQFANGGALSNGVMGEAGPEAVMPLSRGPGGRLGVDASGVMTASRNALQQAGQEVAASREALQQVSQGGGSSGATGANGYTPQSKLFTESRQALATSARSQDAVSSSSSAPLRIETIQIGKLDVVTVEQAKAIADASSARGNAKQTRMLQSSPSARRSMGI